MTMETGKTYLNFDIKNLEEESLPITQQFDFKTNVQSNGDYAFINYNMFTGLQNNPFILNDRFSNVNFGFKKSVDLTYVINIPDNYKVDALPKNIKLVNSDNSVTMVRQFFQSNNQIMAKVKVSIDKTMFPVNQYSGVKDFFKQMVNMMNEQIVLRKK